MPNVNTGVAVQGKALINALFNQLTGKTDIAATNTGDFVSVALAVKQYPANEVFEGMSKVMGRAIFEVRPYQNKFDFIRVTDDRWGAITRKYSVASVDPAEDDTTIFKPGAPTTPLANGDSVDPWVINKGGEILELRILGEVVWQTHITRFEKQLMTALASPAEFVQFWNMVLTEVNNNIQGEHEALARATIINFIGGKIDGDPDNVIHCITKYKDETGDDTVTAENVYEDIHFVPFVKWLYAYINTLSGYMTNRTALYHMPIAGKTILKHTPVASQRCLMLSKFANAIKTNVLSSVFNKDEMKTVDYTTVDFWQSIKTPYGISIPAQGVSYPNPTDGSKKTNTNAITQSGVIGMLYDVDALATNIRWDSVNASTLNPRGLYSNIFWHMTKRAINNFDENAVVLLLD